MASSAGCGLAVPTGCRQQSADSPLQTLWPGVTWLILPARNRAMYSQDIRPISDTERAIAEAKITGVRHSAGALWQYLWLPGVITALVLTVLLAIGVIAIQVYYKDLYSAYIFLTIGICGVLLVVLICRSLRYWKHLRAAVAQQAHEYHEELDEG